MMLSVPASAQAAPNQVVVDSITFVTQQGVPIEGFEDSTKQWLEVDLSIPGNAVAPVSGTVHLPGELLGQPERIVLYAPDGTPNGYCDVRSTYVFCELDDDYVNAHPVNMSGSFRFEVQVSVGNTEEIDKEFPIGDVWTNEVTIRPQDNTPGPICEDNCDLKPEPGTKMGWYYKEDETIGWEVRVPTPGSEGTPVGVPVVVIDEIDESLFELLPGSPYVEYYDAVIRGDDGRESFWYRNTLPRDQFTVSADKTVVSFTSTAGLKGDPSLPADVRGLEGRVYWVTWAVKVRDNGAAGTYHNTARVIVGDDGDEMVLEGEAIRQGGSGEAVGANQGRLEFEKFLDGEAADDPALPSSYTVSYTACDTTRAGYNPATHTGPGCADSQLELIPGQKVWTPTFPAGTRVKGTEVAPSGPSNVEWNGEFALVDSEGNPVAGSGPDTLFDVTFSQENSNLGALTYYRVTNRVDYRNVPFSARKIVQDNDGLEPEGLPAFILNYEYAAAPDGSFEAGSGSLELLADGTPAVSADLPIGAELVFTESAPAEIPGAVWGTPTITPSSLVLTSDLDPETTVNVEVTNPLDVNVGRFVAEKAIDTDDEIDLSEHPGFTLEYEYDADPGRDIEAGSGSLTLPADGQPVISEDLPIGAVLRFTEATPVDVPGATWGAASIVPSELTITADLAAVVNVVVTNPLDLDPGFFSARKVIDNPNEVDLSGVIPDLPAFTLNYSYVDPTSSLVVEKTMLLPADGDAVASEEIPIGVEVSLEETAPAGVPGYVWGEVAIDPTTFIMANENPGDVDINVTVTNTLAVGYGGFDALKRVVNEAGIDIASVDEFDLFYEYSAVGNIPAGYGFLTIQSPGPGETAGPLAQSGEIPYGAKVEVSEVNPPGVPGAIWGTPSVTPSEFTLGPDSRVTVEATNTIAPKFGTFRARKDVVNEHEIDLGAIENYQVAFEYEDLVSGDTVRGTLDLPADGSVVQGPSLAHGTVVRVSEESPAVIPGAEWEAPVLSTDEIVIDTEAPYPVTLTVTNAISPKIGTFFAQKTVENPDDVDLSGVGEYELRYAYTAVGLHPAGEGTLKLRGDGTRAEGPELPHGTVVTVSEVAPVAVPGATWQEPSLSTTEFTIDTEAEAVIVGLVNRISADPPPGSGPPPGSPLPPTGLASLQWFLVAALLLLCGGAALYRRGHRAKLEE